MLSTRYSCRILIKLEFSRQILEQPQISIFIQIRPVGVELFYVDEQMNKRRDAHDEIYLEILRKLLKTFKVNSIFSARNSKVFHRVNILRTTLF
jgi:hypothetical protein